MSAPTLCALWLFRTFHVHFSAMLLWYFSLRINLLVSNFSGGGFLRPPTNMCIHMLLSFTCLHLVAETPHCISVLCIGPIKTATYSIVGFFFWAKFRSFWPHASQNEYYCARIFHMLVLMWLIGNCPGCSATWSPLLMVFQTHTSIHQSI